LCNPKDVTTNIKKNKEDERSIELANVQIIPLCAEWNIKIISNLKR
jgi:hypothetical protein